MSSSQGEQFSLVWNTFPRNLSSGLYNLLAGEQLVDVTLAAEGQILRAHKLILSVCSTYFRDLFKGNSCKHPIVILKDVNYRDLSAMLHFMYQGEVNIKQEDIASFLKVAEILKIKGLTRNADDDDEFDKDQIEVTQNFESACNKQLGKGGRADSPCHCTNNTKSYSNNNNRDSNTSNLQESFMSNMSVYNLSAVNDENTVDDADDAMEENASTCQENVDSGSIDISDEPLDCSASDKAIKTEYDYRDQKTGIGVLTSVDDNRSVIKPNINLTKGNGPNISQEGSESLDAAQTPHILQYNPSHCQNEPLGFTEPQSNSTNETTESVPSSSKGRRTVKGIPGSSLSLETTLRVISELGPTLRMERGKVIRMYSCPWCLRHFTRKENLKLHVRYIHGPLESLTCKLCGNKYKNSNSLRVHSYLYHNAQRNKGSGKSSVVEGNA